MDYTDPPPGSTGSKSSSETVPGNSSVQAGGTDVPRPKRRPGRPRRSEGPAVSREAIIHEALVSLTANGSAGFALRDIARRLGVSLPTLQRHFPTKDDLWRACVDAIAEDVPIDETDAVHDNSNPLLSNFVRRLIERTTKYPRATAAMWNDNEPGSEERLNYLLERFVPRMEIGRQNLASAVAVGVFREVDPDVFMALLGLGVSSLVSSRYPLQKLFGIDLNDEEQREHFAQALSEILLFGLVSREDAMPAQRRAV